MRREKFKYVSVHFVRTRSVRKWGRSAPWEKWGRYLKVPPPPRHDKNEKTRNNPKKTNNKKSQVEKNEVFAADKVKDKKSSDLVLADALICSHSYYTCRILLCYNYSVVANSQKAESKWYSHSWEREKERKSIPVKKTIAISLTVALNKDCAPLSLAASASSSVFFSI